MRNRAILFSAVLMLVLSAGGIFYATRVVVAQILYSHAKYRTTAGECQRIIGLCSRASAYYGYNYYACILAAETAYYESFVTVGKEAARNFVESQVWCDKGLKLNYYRMPLRRLKASLVSRNSAIDAVRYWEEFVNWQYWEPANHAFLVELYAIAGLYDKAVDSLSFIKEFPCHQDASRKLSEIWNKEKSLPAEVFSDRSK